MSVHPPARRRTRVVAVAATLVVAVVAPLTVTAVASADDTLPGALITPQTAWSYSADGSNPAPGADRLAWTRASFDDSGWREAAGAFGAKNGSATPDLGAGFPVATVLPLWLDAAAATKVDVPTYHFRSDFSLTADQIAGIASLTGTVTYDDAVQVFVNGTKVAGFLDARVEAAAEDTRNLTYAGESKGDPQTSTFTVPASALVEGVNTIAVALHQDRENSSDAYLNVSSLVPVGKDSVSTTISDIVLGIGSDQTQRTLNWYTTDDTAQVAQLAPASAVTGEQFPAAAVTVPATGEATTSGEYSRKATLTGLRPDTAYVYRVGTDGNWSAVNHFTTPDFAGGFQFLLMGDPQIGASGDTAADQAGWADTLNVAQAAYPDAEFVFSAGDQVERAGNESHYDAFLAPEQIRSLPQVVTNGNHDVGSKAYEQHFNIPNYDPSAGAASSGSSSGGDYWFRYNDVLFVNINSNSRDYASHNAFMEKVVAEQGATAKWKVLAFHHSIYSVAAHTDDADILDRRANMPAKISELGFDVVLQGHDHSYTRSYLIEDGEVADATELAGQQEVTADAGEVLYVTANSASGSKYYNVKAPDAWFASVINQERVRNYSVVEVADDAIVIKTLRSQASGEQSVNSVVDEVTLRREVDPNAQSVQVEVPEGAPGEFVWSVDGSNRIVDMGVAADKGDRYAAAGALNPIRVTDTRRAKPEWSVSAKISDFVAGNDTFSGGYLGWTPRVVEEGGDAIAGASVASRFDGGAGLSESAVLGYANGGHLRGSAKLGADLQLSIPVEVDSGTYRATLTLTAIS